VIIPNGVFLEELEPLPTAGEFRSRFPELGDAPYVLFLSRLHFKKGLDYLSDSFAAVAKVHPQVKLVVVGPEDGAGEDFRQRIRSAGLENRVLMPGPLYGVDKLRALVDAAVFCLPSRQEGFSVAILEALACRSPVVISDECHFPEVQTEGAGYSTPLTNQAVTEALLKVLADPQQAKSMGDRGRAMVESRYTWQAVAKQSLELYERLLARS
jgi:glycosyltransferase involved in cell wall biosynthesis